VKKNPVINSNHFAFDLRSALELKISRNQNPVTDLAWLGTNRKPAAGGACDYQNSWRLGAEPAGIEMISRRT
jgi:hypothetical protein